MKQQCRDIGAPAKLVRLPQVELLTGLSRSTIYRLIAAGELQQPVRISARASAWPLSEIIAYCDRRIAARDAAEGRSAKQ